jgi:hypothetical protein
MAARSFDLPTPTPPSTNPPEGEYDLEIRPAGTADVAFDIDPPRWRAARALRRSPSLLAEGTTVLPAVDAQMMTDDMAAEWSDGGLPEAAGERRPIPP